MNMKEMKAKADAYLKRKMSKEQKFWAELLREADERWNRGKAESSLFDSFEYQAEAVMRELKKRKRNDPNS